MKHALRTLRAAAAACLVLAGSAVFAEASAPAEEPLAALQAAYAQAVTPGDQADLYRELFASVLQRVQRSYASEVDLAGLVSTAMKVLEPLPPGTGEPAQVFGRAINAALATLDRHSRYLDPRSAGFERGDASGSFSGLGLEVQPADTGVRVVAPIPGSPAARAGLQSGDLIVRVDEQPLLGMPLADAIARMRGQPGTSVTLAIRRGGAGEEISVSLTRDTIRRQALHWAMEGEVLVLRLGSFSTAVTASLRKAIEEATAAGAPRAVVLDLRGNPGGLLREAVTVADTFLSKGDIASLHGRTPAHQRSWQADPDEVLAGLPMVVLVDARSASASELVAAALQDNGRATVMGQRSFGKGSVQSTYALGAETRGTLKLTTSHYRAPSGRAVHQAGVTPDIELVSSQPVADAAAPRKPQVEQGRCPALYKAADPALSCAVAYLLSGDREAFVLKVAAPQ